MSIFRRASMSRPLVRKRPAAGLRPARRLRPRLSALEGRTLLSQTLTVTNTNDSGPGSLRAEVAAAQDGDTIVFAPRLDGRTIALTSGPILDTGTSLMIRGPGAALLTVSGGGRSGIFDLEPADPSRPPFAVAITGLTLAHAAGPDSSPSAAITDSNASLTLAQDVIADNRNGGVQVFSGYLTNLPPTVNVTITGTAFLNNQSDGPGGALDVHGVVLSVGSSLFAGNSTAGPTSPAPLGGAIFITGTSATNFAGGVSSTIDGSQFVGNSALWNGGAIENEGEALTITNSSFVGNRAAFGGGALQNEWVGVFGGGPSTGPLTIQGSTFVDNQAVGFDSSSHFPSDASGGAINIINVRAAVSISGSTFIGNLARGGDGGAGFGGAASGGAISEGFAAGMLTRPPAFAVDGSTFVGNRAVGGHGDAGGGIAQGGAVSVDSFVSTTITHSDFRSNEAVGGSGGAGEPIPFFDTEALAAFGGAIQMISQGPATISGDSFEQNMARGGDGGPGLSGGTGEGGAINGYYSNLTLSDLSFTGNRALGGRGGDAPAGSSAPGGSGGQAAGGAFAYLDFFGNIFGGTSATITGIHSSGDRAIGGAGGGDGAGGAGGDALGGGIWNGGFMAISSSHFSGDRATGGDGGRGGASGAGGAGGNAWGGALASGVSIAPDDSLALSITGSRFDGNRADGGDGGLGTTEGADGEGHGGAIAILAGPATISRSKFAGNKASTSDDDIFGSYTS